MHIYSFVRDLSSTDIYENYKISKFCPVSNIRNLKNLNGKYFYPRKFEHNMFTLYMNLHRLLSKHTNLRSLEGKMCKLKSPLMH